MKGDFRSLVRCSHYEVGFSCGFWWVYMELFKSIAECTFWLSSLGDHKYTSIHMRKLLEQKRTLRTHEDVDGLCYLLGIWGS